MTTGGAAGLAARPHDHMEVVLHMAERRYRIEHIQNGKLDHVSEHVFSEADGRDMLNASRLLHRLTGWDVWDCACGFGYVFEKGGVLRSEHLIPAKEYAEIEPLLGKALATAGVLEEVSS